MIDEADARIGKRLGNYTLLDVIGRGGMGVVYRAEHTYIGKPCAVKVLYQHQFDKPRARERFLREAQAASAVSHPNIVGVTDFGEADGTVFLVMAHVPGVPLDRVLRTEGRLPLFRSLVILSQVSRALGAAHAGGVIHRDLKPENVMLESRPGRREIVREVADELGTLELVQPEGHYDHVTLLDFGAAKFFDRETTIPKPDGSGVVIGTPIYMAPETARVGLADERSDIYALGVMMFEMLTGVVPFDGADAIEVMVKHVQDNVPLPRDLCPQAEITSPAEYMILKAMRKDPNERYQSMEEVQSDLQRCYGQLRFRRSVRVLPDSPTAATLRKPIPLVNPKRKGDSGSDLPAVPFVAVPSSEAPGSTAPGPLLSPALRTTAAPAPEAPAPILLTKRKSGRHRTLPLGAMTPTPSPLDVGNKPPKT